ncbi:MAG: acyl CoA:acetate/3-ketoacid CoA transferase [Lachnospirales bacterium]
MREVSFLTGEQAVAKIPDNAVVGTVGFMLTGTPEELFIRIEERFLKEKAPKNITMMFASGIGDGTDRFGINHLCHEGLLKRIICGHYGLIPKISPLVNENKIEAYNFPQGVLTSLFREMAGNRPGLISSVGMHTYIDPDQSGGKLNDVTKEDLVIKVNIENEDYLFYKSQKLDVALLRGTEADDMGNIGYSEEALMLENLAVATACKGNGGKVIVQVKRKVKNGDIPPRLVSIPHTLVDYVVVVDDENNHKQTGASAFNKEFISASSAVIEEEFAPVPLDMKQIVARRAVLEINKDMMVVNYGIGMPEKVAEIVAIEGYKNAFSASVEPGVVGGNAQGGLDFGSAINPQGIITHPQQFDVYDSGGIDISFLGMAQVNAEGNINVSKFGPKIPGCGGFINISQSTKNMVFCGNFTAGGLKIEIANGEVKILQEGKVKKFINDLEQITYNGKYEYSKGKKTTIITERAVFEVRDKGLTLTEIAPGIDLEKDILAHMEFKPQIAEDLKIMDKRIFTEGKMNLVL